MKPSPPSISTPPCDTDDEALPRLAGEEGDDAEPAESAEGELREALLGPDHHGLRLDRALVAVVPELSRNYLQQLIESGAVRLNGQPAAKPSAKVKAGDRLAIAIRPTLQSQAFQPQAMDLDTVYLDAHLRVVHKPAGLVVHPAPGNWSGTLLNGLLGCDPLAATLPRAGIVHRLDKDTSGLMVVARSRAAMDALVAAIAARTVSRQYIALAHGRWTGPSARRVDAAMGRDPRNRLRMAVVDLARGGVGKPASTDFALLDNGQAACVLRCTLHTGRTHQIRVHAASLGHPLLADTLYGGRVLPGEEGGGLQRQALHAQRLAFNHPLTGVPLAFEAPLPDDLRAAVAALGLHCG